MDLKNTIAFWCCQMTVEATGTRNEKKPLYPYIEVINRGMAVRTNKCYNTFCYNVPPSTINGILEGKIYNVTN